MADFIVLEESLFIQKYYYYVLFYFIFLLVYGFIDDIKGKSSLRYFFFYIFSFFYIVFLSYYLGHRDLHIGTDTNVYEYFYSNDIGSNNLLTSGDILYFVFQFIFIRLGFGFSDFMFFCALFYMLTVFYAFKNFFSKNMFYAYIFFLISPYFMLFGINGVRNGMAASFFLLGLSYLFMPKKNMKKTGWIIMVMSIFLHLSLIFPLILFMFKKHIRNHERFLVIWCFAVLFMLLDINILASIITVIPIIGGRFGEYVNMRAYTYDLTSFIVFGVPPIFLGAYILIKKKITLLWYEDIFNVYILLHIFYVLLLKTTFAVRIGYISEFMMALILCTPFLSRSILRVKFFYTKYLFVVLMIFMLKAYKILIL
ncbi:EpsG family protein [Myroides marinus]|uniref:EpsG family protein n=1 Tax=Myroides marinus TaxID=703342 RepID=UPI002575C4C4|nr:EpsG family protein [Myroides marinus]MDM1503175.1 EpsG family protein [Myroides marinus]